MAESVAKRGAVLLVGSVHHIAKTAFFKEISSNFTNLTTHLDVGTMYSYWPMYT